LGEGYIQGLMEQYDQEQLRAYLHGEFVNLTDGTVYKNYNRGTHHSDRVVQPNDILHIGMDFNITKMASIIHVIDGNIKIAVAELVNVYDTEQMITLFEKQVQKQNGYLSRCKR